MTILYESRMNDFGSLLTSNGIPFSGLTNPDGTVEAMVINYSPAATPEQITFGNDAKANFDWRPRRMIDRNIIVNTLASMTQAQQNAVLRHIVAAFIREHKQEALDIIATLQANFPIDEVDPNP